MGFTSIKASQLAQTACYRSDDSKYGDSFRQTHVSHIYIIKEEQIPIQAKHFPHACLNGKAHIVVLVFHLSKYLEICTQ